MRIFSGNTICIEEERQVYGGRRVLVKFLFLPKSLKGQTRWLETAAWVEERQNTFADNYEWVPKDWWKPDEE